MTNDDIKKLAFDLTNTTKTVIVSRDVRYDPSQDIFFHQPSTDKHKAHGATFQNGERKSIVAKSGSILIGRYDADVNPFWVIEDIMSVQ